MHKTLIILLSLQASASMAKDQTEPCLGVQQLAPQQLTFFYNQHHKNDTPYFYIKALRVEENPEQSAKPLINMGENLQFVQESIPSYYQISDQAKTLYIIQSPKKLPDVDPLTQVEVEMIATRPSTPRPKRNVGSAKIEYMSNQPQLVEKMPNILGTLNPEPNDIKVCKLDLKQDQ